MALANEIEEMFKIPLPVFCNFTVWLADVDPTFWLPKFRDAGVTEATGNVAPLIKVTKASLVPPP